MHIPLLMSARQRRSLDNGKQLPYCGRQQIVDNKLWRSTRTPTALYLGMHVWHQQLVTSAQALFGATLMNGLAIGPCRSLSPGPQTHPNPFLKTTQTTPYRDCHTTQMAIYLSSVLWNCQRRLASQLCSRCLQHISASSRTNARAVRHQLLH